MPKRKVASPKGDELLVPPPPESTSLSTMTAADIRARAARKFDKYTVPDPLSLSSFEIASSGSLVLDRILGVGGYARGRITTFTGEQHAGKTFLALMGVASIQRHVLTRENRHARVAFIDAEQAYSESLAELAGCNIDPTHFALYRPDSLENALRLSLFLLGLESGDGRIWKPSGMPPSDVVVLDSWAGAATEGVGLSERARIGAEWMPTINVHVNRSDAWYFVTNHIRERPGVTFGNPEYEPGGEALQNMRSVALIVHKVEKEYITLGGTGTKRPIAHKMRVEIGKNKLAAGVGQKCNLRMHYYEGFDRVKDALELLEHKGIKLKEDASTMYRIPYNGSEIKAVGETNFLNLIRNDPMMLEAFIYYAQTVEAITRYA